jgi:hypothetical protein
MVIQKKDTGTRNSGTVEARGVGRPKFHEGRYYWYPDLLGLVFVVVEKIGHQIE